jgi:glycosyltransferase involved in cell wall biosynthesis
MRVLHVSTFPRQGGAGIAASRLTSGLRKLGVDAWLGGLSFPGDCREFEIPVTFGRSPTERMWRNVRHLQLKEITRRNDTLATGREILWPDRSCYGHALARASVGFDLLHLHWVANFLDYGYNLPKMAARVPIVWTLHDMNPFTGGCSYATDCKRFQHGCGLCPLLESEVLNDESNRIFRRKRRAFNQLLGRLHLVAPSRWIAEEAGKSPLCGDFPVEVIRNGLDTAVFKPMNRDAIKSHIGLRTGDPVCLCVAADLQDSRKGVRLLLDALPRVVSRFPNLQVVVVGGNAEAIAGVARDVTAIQPKGEEPEMAEIYNCADLLVIPSLIDNLPNVIAESLSCGVPVVGFKAGGIPEMIGGNGTGVLATEVSGEALAAAMMHMLEMPREKMEENRNEARRAALLHYDIAQTARQHCAFYAGVLSRFRSL